MSRCEDEQMWEKMWEKMWRWADVREDVKMSRCERRCERRCEDEQMWEKMWRWADVKMSRCERRCERRCEDEQMWEKMWRWADVREDVKMSRCERRCERRCEDDQMWEKMRRWADVKMSRCERRCEDEQMWEKMWRWEDVLQTPTIGRTLRSDALGKKVRFLEKSPFGSDGSKPDGYFRTLDAFFILSDAVRTALSKKRYVWRKKAFACLRCMGKSSKDKLSPKLSNSPACPQLSVETYPHACNNERAKRVQNPKQARSKPWHQTRKREPIVWKSLLLDLQAAKTKMAPATMSCKLACGTFIWFPQFQLYLHEWTSLTCKKQYLISGKVLSEKNCNFSWKTPKIKGRWRVKVYIYI